MMRLVNEYVKNWHSIHRRTLLGPQLMIKNSQKKKFKVS